MCDANATKKVVSSELSASNIERTVLWLCKLQSPQDGSWYESGTRLRGVPLLKQKIVYTNQVLRTFAEIGLDDKHAQKGLAFLRKAPLIGIGLYDYALRFFPLHDFGILEEAQLKADTIATEQRRSGNWEWKRHHLQWFGPLFGLEILAICDRKKYRVEIERSLRFLLRNKDNDDWDGSPSITSWILRLLRMTGNVDKLPRHGMKTIEWLQMKQVGSVWKLDFIPDPTTITPQIGCDLNTTCHIVYNISEFIEIMDLNLVRDCIQAPLLSVANQFQTEGYWLGKTKPDAYITALAARALVAGKRGISRFHISAKKREGLIEKLLKSLEGEK